MGWSEEEIERWLRSRLFLYLSFEHPFRSYDFWRAFKARNGKEMA